MEKAESPRSEQDSTQDGSTRDQAATVLEAALQYAREGRVPVPVRFRGKAPTLNEWPQCRADEDEVRRLFGGRVLNVGIAFGEPSGGLVDVDLDWPEAEALAPEFLLLQHVYIPC